MSLDSRLQLPKGPIATPQDTAIAQFMKQTTWSNYTGPNGAVVQNLLLRNGILVAKYAKIGSTIFFRIFYQVGSSDLPPGSGATLYAPQISANDGSTQICLIAATSGTAASWGVIPPGTQTILTSLPVLTTGQGFTAQGTYES